MTTESVTTRPVVPERGERLPLFTGTTPGGEQIRLRDFYPRRNLALVFSHGPDCEPCQQILHDLVAVRPVVQAELGEILVVISGTPVNVPDLPYPILLDRDNEIHRRYGLIDTNGQPRAAIFLVDRYSVVFEASIATGSHAILPIRDVPGWMEFIACRCS